MKKKISLVLITILAFVVNINLVGAANSFSNGYLPACGFDYMPTNMPNFTSGLYNIIKLLVPIILIVMGMVDFAKAVMASDEKKMKDSQKKFITRLIAAVIVFLVMAVVQFVFKKIDTENEYKSGFVNCINCMLNGDKTACGAGTKDLRKQCSQYEGRNCPDTDNYGNQCMPYNNGSTYGGCKIRGYDCEDYTADECPPTTLTGTRLCAVINNKCLPSCSGLGISSCSQYSSYCKWDGSVSRCVNK